MNWSEDLGFCTKKMELRIELGLYLEGEFLYHCDLNHERDVVHLLWKFGNRESLLFMEENRKNIFSVESTLLDSLLIH